jgi:X-X-X-Leu-X-X-Gly heptad repeat protein
MMRIAGMMAGALTLSLLGTGCATKKYVAKTVAPVEQRVTGTENKNTEQDKQISSQGTEIQELDRDLSRTKEKVNDTDAKATQAGQAARAADEKATGARQAADGAQTAANGAQQAATGARSFAEEGLNRVDRNMAAMNKFKMIKTEVVLFTVNTDKLSKDAKAELDEFGKQASGLERYVVEVQGFTDKTGDAAYNDVLSERRAQNVARYLTNEHKIPLRSINVLGEGYAQPVADDKTREGRKQNRRVEVKLWVPENSTEAVASAGSAQ